MASTVTATKDTSFNQNIALESFQARGGVLEMGTLAFGSMPGAGFPCSFDVGRLVGAFIASFNGYVFEFDATNNLITVYGQASNVLGALTLIASKVDLSACSGVPYLAFGWGK